MMAFLNAESKLMTRKCCELGSGSDDADMLFIVQRGEARSVVRDGYQRGVRNVDS